ncbi:hypothetical protein [Guptibacillus hwajinpoensis]|uniref:hypothetical protein n=1 Tax=Guptibacillus hwajinpoensis TaxID=208199 RepID=UPI001CFCFA9C|nr:hypothetical protein [Pseudalkalibacillus hwajinpoensis]WLR61076.1 hypothetical protein LC071_07085 [Pseudalkalibacillus hwajinpoensis]
MLEREVFHQYGIVIEQHNVKNSGYLLRTSDQSEFILRRALSEQESEFPWYVMVANFLNQQNEPTMLPISSRRGKYIETIQNEAYVLYQKPYDRNNRIHHSDGSRLALFHRKAGNLLAAYNELPEIQPWQMRWQYRIDQLESFREELKNQTQPLREFDEWFIETFPYYSGLSENAIQYIVDCGIDMGMNPFQLRTLAFNRYTANYHRTSEGLFPNDLILDHPARDLAEWIRYELVEGEGNFEGIRQFMWDYHERRTLTQMDWNLLYARLLFPIPYVETVEHYYSDGNLKEKEKSFVNLKELVRREGEREEMYRLLFQELIGEYGKQMRRVDWLN